MHDLAKRALDTADQRGAGYADVRIVRLKSESVEVRNRNVEALSSDKSLGFGVRWFSASFSARTRDFRSGSARTFGRQVSITCSRSRGRTSPSSRSASTGSAGCCGSRA